ncbi:MAG: hypothetical protein DMF99_26085 [Acidobacteria bacterium]|nr:MAG: hypothetical protein DMF99_26085 [Acidobacteriota bacterium]
MGVVDPVQRWNELLEEEQRTTATSHDQPATRLCASLAEEMRARRLTFGGRLLCPFLRPFFLDSRDEARVKDAAETLWILGERVAQAALSDDTLLADLALSPDEIRLARIDPGYATVSTAARADAFVLPDSLQFAEYNGESPAGAGYAQGLAEVFGELALMRRLREDVDARMYRPVDVLLDALVASYREWGGTARPPQIAIVDWKEVPTFSEFELLRDAFAARGVPTIVCDPRDLDFASARLTANDVRIDLVYRRVLINDIVSRAEECRALLAAYEAGAVCVANSLRCKIPHKKAFFAVLTDERRSQLFSERERAVIRRHVPWTALVRQGNVRLEGGEIDLIPHLRRHRNRFVIKPNDEYGGTGVTLGWETSEAQWDGAIARALAERERGWIAQEKIAVRREIFPMCANGGVEMRDMLVDFAPYLFRGALAGFLTRLSATGLANVTSGGGQVPAFVVTGKMD